MLIIFAAGAIMEEQAAKNLGVKICKFIPKHARNLANEFRCYVNYASGLDWASWEDLQIFQSCSFLFFSSDSVFLNAEILSSKYCFLGQL